MSWMMWRKRFTLEICLGMDKAPKNMNILVFTSSGYPSHKSPKGAVAIVKYFCEEWARQGHNVVVIVSSAKFPLLYYLLPNRVKRTMENKLGSILPNSINRKQYSRIEEGVNIFQVPVRKIIPGEIVSQRQINKNFKTITSYLNNLNFNPDITIGHWLNPQIMLLDKAKKHYNCKTALTLHEVPSGKYTRLISENLKSIDRLGFRNKNQQIQSNGILSLNIKNQYLCYSGVTDYFNVLKSDYKRKPKSDVIKVCFVGDLIQRKYPEKIVEALSYLKSNKKYEVHYVGDGKMGNLIKKLEYPDNIKVILHGRLDRINTYNVIAKCDFLTMISKNELYGLVYLEAMLNRTIPIASYNEGFDGIILNRDNGFLCNAGDARQLSEIFKELEDLSENEYFTIQESAYKTAQEMTDQKMASKYLEDISVSK